MVAAKYSGFLIYIWQTFVKHFLQILGSTFAICLSTIAKIITYISQILAFMQIFDWKLYSHFLIYQLGFFQSHLLTSLPKQNIPHICVKFAKKYSNIWVKSLLNVSYILLCWNCYFIWDFLLTGIKFHTH